MSDMKAAGPDYRVKDGVGSIRRGSFCFILFILVLSAPLSAATFNGRLSSDFYGYTVGDQDHLQSYIGLRAYTRLWSDQSKRELTFHTYSRWTSDMIDKQARDPEFSVYSAFFRLDRIILRTRLQLGRQFAYSAAGSALIDGARATVTPMQNMEVELFGGSSVTRIDPEEVNSFSDEGVLGARVTYLYRNRFKPSLHWFFRKYDGNIDQNRIGCDLSARFDRLQTYGRITYDIERLSLAEYMARAAYSDRSWYIAGEWLSRDPSVPAHSIFSLIDYDRYKQARLELRRKTKASIWLVGNLTVTFFDIEDDAVAIRAGLQSSLFSVGWNHQTGYAGQRDGLYGNVYYKLTRSFTLYSRADLSRYKIQDQVDDRTDAYAAVAGLQWRHELYEARIEGQYLRNAVASDDTRIRISLSRGFEFGE